MKNNEVLWEQSLDASTSWLFIGFEITFIGSLITWTIYNLYLMYKNGVHLDIETFVEFGEIGVCVVVYFYIKVNQLFVATTLHYQIEKDALLYCWGIKNGTVIRMPFKDITAINLVEYYNSDYSTIYIVTKGNYKLHKMNFADNAPRHTYTLEQVENGPAVYQLMMNQWNLAAA